MSTGVEVRDRVTLDIVLSGGLVEDKDTAAEVINGILYNQEIGKAKAWVQRYDQGPGTVYIPVNSIPEQASEAVRQLQGFFDLKRDEVGEILRCLETARNCAKGETIITEAYDRIEEMHIGVQELTLKSLPRGAYRFAPLDSLRQYKEGALENAMNLRKQLATEVPQEIFTFAPEGYAR